MLDACGLKSVNKDSSKTLAGLMCLLTAVQWHCVKVEEKSKEVFPLLCSVLNILFSFSF